jgi:GT2 family glycosyltransferase
MAVEPTTSVVILTYNGRKHLERCLPSVLADSEPRLEVIVVDNASSDDTCAWLAATYPQARVVPLPTNLGFGEGNRRGALAARGVYLAFLNNDTVVSKDWLAPLRRALEADPAVAATCSTLRLLAHPDTLNARGGAMTRLGYGHDNCFGFPAMPRLGPEEPETRPALFPTAAAMLMRRQEFLDIGGFDPAMFMYHEDVELGWRLWLTGRKVLVCRDSVVYHHFGGTPVSADRLAWRERLGMRHNLRTLISHYSAKTLLRALVGVAKVWYRHRAFGQAVAVLAWNLGHLPGTLKRRRRLQRRRVLSDRELLSSLISPAAFPPPAPELARVPPPRERDDLIASSVLLPGQHSALGRLGPGWYARERHPDGWWRWSCGQALATLRVQPLVSGELLASVQLPIGAHETAAVELEVNGARARFELAGERWHEIRMPATSDTRGMLAIEIHSPSWVPHESRRNWDFRHLGCAVRELRFSPTTRLERARIMSASVIIPTYNRWPILEQALEALAVQSWRAFEVIVIDDGSTDDTWERLQGWQATNSGRVNLKLLHQENLKPGRARNLGLRHATGDLVIFIGDDILVAPEFVAEHVAAHERIGEPVGVLGFTDWDRQQMAVTPFLEFVNRDGQQFSYGHFRDGEDLFFTCLYTSNISLPRSLLGDDPFHPAFTFVDWEDVELGYRLSLRGLRLILHTPARARHVHAMTMTRFFRRQEHVGRTVEVLLDLHPALWRDDAMPPLKPPRWHRLARPMVAAALPVLDWLDRRGMAMPPRLYRGVVLTAFANGRREGFRNHSSGSG